MDCVGFPVLDKLQTSGVRESTVYLKDSACTGNQYKFLKARRNVGIFYFLLRYNICISLWGALC
jgi:hypothetical protein